MSVDYPEPVELNTQIRTLKPSDTAGGVIQTSAVYFSVAVMVQKWLLFLMYEQGTQETSSERIIQFPLFCWQTYCLVITIKSLSTDKITSDLPFKQ